jgi:hypothetical protein
LRLFRSPAIEEYRRSKCANNLKWNRRKINCIRLPLRIRTTPHYYQILRSLLHHNLHEEIPNAHFSSVRHALNNAMSWRPSREISIAQSSVFEQSFSIWQGSSHPDPDSFDRCSLPACCVIWHTHLTHTNLKQTPNHDETIHTLLTSQVSISIKADPSLAYSKTQAHLHKYSNASRTRISHLRIYQTATSIIIVGKDPFFQSCQTGILGTLPPTTRGCMRIRRLLE